MRQTDYIWSGRPLTMQPISKRELRRRRREERLYPLVVAVLMVAWLSFCISVGWPG